MHTIISEPIRSNLALGLGVRQSRGVIFLTGNLWPCVRRRSVQKIPANEEERENFGRSACFFVVILCVYVLSSPAARAQGALPATGPDMRVGDLSTQFQQAFGALPQAGANNWSYGASLDLSETFDNGVVRRNGGIGSDLITQVTPGISITGDSTRLTGSLYYAPSLIIYSPDGNLNSIAQNLNGSGTATIIQDLFFVDLRGYAAQQPINGGQGPAGVIAPGGANLAQTLSFSLTPRLQHSFDGTGTAILSDTVTRNILNALNSTQSNAGLEDGNFTSNQVNASFSTGENFGRIGNTLSAVALQYSGTGALQGAHRESIQDSISYAFSRLVSFTASLGHENIVYGPTGPAPINDITWSVGTQLTPNSDTSISLSYGHEQGFTSASLDSSFAPSARTRVYARYSQGVGTQQESLQTALSSSAVGPGGIAIDSVTGAPLVLTNNFLGTQTSVYHTTSASLTGVLLYDRDTISLDLQYVNNVQLSAITVGNIGSSTGTYGSVAWAHNVSDDLRINTFFQYGTLKAVGGNQDDLLLSLSLNYVLSPTLSASAQYSHTQTTGATFGLPPSADIATIALHKTF